MPKKSEEIPMAMRLAAELLWGAPWPHFQLDTSEAHQRHLGGITGDDPQMNHPEATNNQKTQMMVNQKLRIFFWGGVLYKYAKYAY